jgi:dsDNA-specific endonuclease/ATPase MutS2
LFRTTLYICRHNPKLHLCAFIFIFITYAFFAISAISVKALLSETAISASIFLLIVTPAFFKPEINLLGYTVDEAISILDKYLDDAYIAKIPQVRIVHGKGTGALRNGITSYLRGVSYIASFRLGNIGEGDAGVTIVDFK